MPASMTVPPARSRRRLWFGGRLGGSWSEIVCLPHATKAVDIIAKTHIRIAGTLVVAVAGSAILGAEPPSTAANHLVWAFIRPARVPSRGARIIVHLVEIVAPLPDVAAHVVKTPRIGLLLSDRPGMAA